MTLPSITYTLFLLSVVGIFWAITSAQARLWLLFVASLVFYASLHLQYLPLMLGLVIFNFYMAKFLTAPMDWRIPNERWQLAEKGWNRRRRVLLWVGIGVNTLLLLGFKYIDGILNGLGIPLENGAAIPLGNDRLMAIVMPLGISFFCFECIAYLVDVYRGSPPAQRFVDFAAYKLFFPKLISGPITRFHGFMDNFEQQSPPGLANTIEGAWLIAFGAVKKLLIADHIAIMVNLSFSNLERAGSADIWLATFAYGLQLYIDFSAYVDIARGSAILLGINLPQNFDFPYFTTSIAEFWRRWHMTLGAWLRNYLYFPLGGSRKGLLRTCINLMIVMLVAGIWHGNNWGFVVWGAIHGTGLVVHRLGLAIAKAWKPLMAFWQSLPGVVLAWALTQFLVFFSWLFFRLPEPQQFMLAVQRLWGVPADAQFAQKVYLESLGYTSGELLALLACLVGLMGIAYLFRQGLKVELSWPVKLLLVPICCYLAWALAPAETLPYIYFDF
jgi:alginate O-acetyltransferase complex protein AlgI